MPSPFALRAFGLSAFVLAAAACGPNRGFTDTGFRPLEDVVVPDRVALESGTEPSTEAGSEPFGDGSTDSQASDSSDGSALDASDSALLDAPSETATDAALEANTADTPVDSQLDASLGARCTTAPTIDGTIGTDWPSSVPRLENTVPSGWNPMLNELLSLRACHDGDQLYLALEGTAEAGAMRNAMLVYIDRDFGRASGVADLRALTDRSGALDVAAALPFELTGGAMDFAAEGVWGSLGMTSVEPTRTDEAAGLRLFFPAGGSPDRRSDFAWIQGVTTRCSTTARACEVSIPLRALFERPAPMTLPLPTTIALFARLVSGQGGRVSNQTLPQDNPDMPLRVSRILTIDVR